MQEPMANGTPTSKKSTAIGRFFVHVADGIATYIPMPAFFIFLLGIIMAALHIASCASPDFADSVNQTLAAGVRFFLAKLTDVLPFSFAETLIFSLPVILALVIWVGIRRASNKRCFVRLLVVLLALLVLLYSLFVLTIGCAYHGRTLDKKIGLVRKDVSVSELYSTAEFLLAKTNEVAEDAFQMDEGSATRMPYTIDEMNEILLASYESLGERYSFVQTMRTRIKPVAASVLMSYAHITGVYTYMTGEANINVDFPDYTIPFTAAHELAHQRGVAREDEANFIAFLVCISSEDAYVRYSGYMNMFEYVASALYSADPEAYGELIGQASPKVIAEMRAYRAFYDKYRDSVVGEISGSINDAYLQMQGTPGTRSYGMVVDLAVAYYRDALS